jgi:ligand-binding SRPBCC domain-containing protein
MTIIHLITKVNAPIEEVFDLSRNIDVHQLSASQTGEKAIAGRTSGLINLDETVTFKGKHFQFYLHHTSKITAFQFPKYFVDEMVKGHFKSFRHEHRFEVGKHHTIMTDELSYEMPFGLLGKLFDILFLKNYVTRFLMTRNNFLKQSAETQVH